MKQHIENLKKHLETRRGKKVLNRNRMRDTFAFDISLTVVHNAMADGTLPVNMFYKLMGIKLNKGKKK